MSDPSLREKLTGARQHVGHLLVIEWSLLPDAYWVVQSPEAICSILVAPHQFVGPHLSWEARSPYSCSFEGCRNLKTAVLPDGSLEDPMGRPYLEGIFEGNVEVTNDDTVHLQFRMHNQSTISWLDLYAWVCLMQTHTGMPNLTYIHTREGFREAPHVPYVGGFAAARALTERGWALRRQLQSNTMIPAWDPAHEQVVDPLRAMTATIDGQPHTIGIGSSDALIVGGKETNPCTDLGIGFGNIPAGGAGTAELTIYFLPGTLDDLWERVTQP